MYYPRVLNNYVRRLELESAFTVVDNPGGTFVRFVLTGLTVQCRRRVQFILMLCKLKQPP